MEPAKIPDHVLKWIVKKAPPFILICTASPPFGKRIETDEDPELVEEVYKAYLEIKRRRMREKGKPQKSQPGNMEDE